MNKVIFTIVFCGIFTICFSQHETEDFLFDPVITDTLEVVIFNEHGELVSLGQSFDAFTEFNTGVGILNPRIEAVNGAIYNALSQIGNEDALGDDLFNQIIVLDTPFLVTTDMQEQ